MYFWALSREARGTIYGTLKVERTSSTEILFLMKRPCTEISSSKERRKVVNSEAFERFQFEM